MNDALTIAVSLLGGVSVLTIFGYALAEWLRGRFATTADLNGMSERLGSDVKANKRSIERNANLFVALDDRTGDLEERVSVIEERQTQQWERIGDQMNQTAETLRTVMIEVKGVTEMQQLLAVRMERIKPREE